MYYVYSIAEIFACFSMFLIFLIFSGCFLGRISPLCSPGIIIPGLCYILLTAVPVSPQINVLVSLAGLGLLFLILLFSYEGFLLRKVLVLICYASLDLIFSVLFSAFLGILLPHTGDMLFSSGSPARFIYLFSANLTELILVLVLFYFLHPADDMESVPVFTVFWFFSGNFLSLFFCYLILISTESEWIKVLCSAMTVVFILCTLTVLLLLKRLRSQTHELHQKQLLELQVSEQKKMLLQYQKTSSSLQTLRHDLKRYLGNYKTLLDNGNPEAVSESIGNLLASELSAETPDYSSNLLLNSILRQTADRCKSLNIKTSIHAFVPAEYENIEVMVLISNLIDNAVEAELMISDDSRKILINISLEDHQLSIVVQNQIHTSVLSNNPHFRTAKSQSDLHGIGLTSVKRIAEKYNGLVAFKESDGSFIAHVLLPVVSNFYN